MIDYYIDACGSDGGWSAHPRLHYLPFMHTDLPCKLYMIRFVIGLLNKMLICFGKSFGKSQRLAILVWNIFTVRIRKNDNGPTRTNVHTNTHTN